MVSAVQLDHLQLKANKMDIYLFRTDQFGAYIYRMLATPVVGHYYLRAGKAFTVQLEYLPLRHFKNS